MQIPSIIFVNYDSGSVAQNTLKTQLNIDELMNEDEFDARVAVDPNYPVIVHLTNQRILVTRTTFQDHTNRQYADVVLFVKNGLATVLENNYGPPGLSFRVERINLFNMLADIKKLSSRTLSCHRCHCGCGCNCFKHLPVAIQKLLINPYDISGVHNANCDNIFNNPEFINRK